MAHKLAKKLVSVKPGTLSAGIDMALERNMAVLMTERAEVRTQFHFPNDRLRKVSLPHSPLTPDPTAIRCSDP